MRLIRVSAAVQIIHLGCNISIQMTSTDIHCQVCHYAIYGQFSTHAFNCIVDMKIHSSRYLSAPTLPHVVLPLNHFLRQSFRHGAYTGDVLAWHSCLHPTRLVREHSVMHRANSTKASSLLLHKSTHRQAATRIARATYNGRREFINSNNCEVEYMLTIA